MWSGEFMTRSGIKGYNALLTGDKKILSDESYKTKYEVVTELKLTNKAAYNNLILAQEDMVYFQIVEEAKKKANKYGNARQVWIKLSRNIETTTRDSKKRLLNKCKKLYNFELYYITRNPKDLITDIELLRGYLQKLDIQIENS